jgi:hypothetical protein
VHQWRFAVPIEDFSNQSSTTVHLDLHLKIQSFDCQPQCLIGFIHSSVNFPAFTQAINASFCFPILSTAVVDASFPKQLICKTRPFVLQSDVRFVKDSPFLVHLRSQM